MRSCDIWIRLFASVDFILKFQLGFEFTCERAWFESTVYTGEWLPDRTGENSAVAITIEIELVLTS